METMNGFDGNKNQKTVKWFKQFKITFSVYGLGVFLVVLLPNIIYSFVKLENDPFKSNHSAILALDILMYSFQSLMIACLILLKNKDFDWRNRGNYLSKTAVLFYAAAVCLLINYILWICYFAGAVWGFSIFGLAFFPSMVFVLISLWQKNYICTLPAVLFMIFHTTLSCVNLL